MNEGKLESPVILRMQQLELWRARSVVVRDLSLQLRAGQILALTGEYGAGMSAVAQAAAALAVRRGLRVSGGSIWLDAEDLAALPEKKLRVIRQQQVVYLHRQSIPWLNPLRTVREFLQEAGDWQARGQLEPAAPNMLQNLYQVGLAEPESVLDRLPRDLQPEVLNRVLIAMVLQVGAKLLVIDEMTALLDATVQQQILELLVELKNRRNLAILWVTHQPGLIEAVADEVLVMFEGRVIEQGSLADILAAPKQAYTQALMGCAVRLGEERLRLTEISEADRQTVRDIVT
ncbi:MAG: ATP-binding cassette domain-containing protein [Verrucomicrobiales bacterium]|nr:ATP-binding cassette domain-containing protein [Verrucomicrobiales bacterium]